LLLTAASAVGAAAALRPGGLLREDPVPRYRTTAVAVHTLRSDVTATGNLTARHQVDVGSPQSGIVRTVTVDFNDAVEEGQLLAQIDDTQIAAQVRRSEASLDVARARVAEAEAALALAESIHSRMRTLHEESDGRMPSEQDIDSARADVERSRAHLDSAHAEVGLAEAVLAGDRFVLSQMSIYSPIDGVVLNRTIESGQTVAAAFQTPVLFTLAGDLHSMELLVDIDEADIGLIQEGMPATFTVDSFPGTTFPAEIAQVRFASENHDGVVTYTAVLNVDNPRLLLRPGMTATARISVELSDGETWLVPNEALDFARRHELAGSGPGPGVLVLTRNGLRYIPLPLGATNGEMTALLDASPLEDYPLLVLGEEQL
jgi:HlyD family secretion protein